MSEESAGKKVVDWEAVEREYRLGVRSLREIGQQYGLSEGGIRKRAKRDGWDRDLSAKVAARAETLVRKEAVRNEARSTQAANERELVEASAEALKDVLLGHRADIKKAREVVKNLLRRLEGVTNAEEMDIQSLILAVGQNDPAAANGLAKVLSMPNMVQSVKGLTDALKNVIGLERQAFGLKDGESDRPPGDGGGSPAMSNIERDALREFLAARAPVA